MCKRLAFNERVEIPTRNDDGMGVLPSHTMYAAVLSIEYSLVYL